MSRLPAVRCVTERLLTGERNRCELVRHSWGWTILLPWSVRHRLIVDIVRPSHRARGVL